MRVFWYQAHQIVLFLSSPKKKKSYRIYVQLKKKNSICFSFLKFIINTGQRIILPLVEQLLQKHAVSLGLQWIIFLSFWQNCTCVIGRVQGEEMTECSIVLKFYNQVWGIMAQSYSIELYPLPQLYPNILKNTTDAQRLSPQILWGPKTPGRRREMSWARAWELEGMKKKENHNRFLHGGRQPSKCSF